MARTRRTHQSSRKLGVLRRLAKRNASERRRREEELLGEFSNGILPTQNVLAQCPITGAGLEAHEIKWYSESKVTMFPPDQPVNPATLKGHIMHPRTLQPNPKTDFHSARGLLLAHVKSTVEPFGLRATVCPLHPWAVMVGDLPTEDCAFHGTSICSLESICKAGIQPQKCERRCELRPQFGKRAFTTRLLPSAAGWSQYSDVGLVTGTRISHHNCFFSNLVCVVPDGDYQLESTGDATLWPTTFLIELRTESELLRLGRYICPVIGRFEHVGRCAPLAIQL